MLGLAQGHNDQAELTEHGVRQAATVASQFRGHQIRALYASDLRRALRTAAAFADVLGLDVRPDARLRERCLGTLEGAPLTSVAPAQVGVGAGRVIDPDLRPPGGESVRDLYQRAAAFCADLAGLAGPGESAGEAGDVVIVAHGGTLRVLHAYLHGVPAERMAWPPLSNGRVVRVPDFAARVKGGTR